MPREKPGLNFEIRFFDSCRHLSFTFLFQTTLVRIMVLLPHSFGYSVYLLFCWTWQMGSSRCMDDGPYISKRRFYFGVNDVDCRGFLAGSRDLESVFLLARCSTLSQGKTYQSGACLHSTVRYLWKWFYSIKSKPKSNHAKSNHGIQSYSWKCSNQSKSPCLRFFSYGFFFSKINRWLLGKTFAIKCLSNSFYSK